MALDFAQIDHVGCPTGRNVRVSVGDHLALVESGLLTRYPLLSRMSEYYEDAVFDGEELHALAHELADCRDRLAPSGLSEMLNQMVDLVQDSLDKGLLVEAISD